MPVRKCTGGGTGVPLPPRRPFPSPVRGQPRGEARGDRTGSQASSSPAAHSRLWGLGPVGPPAGLPGSVPAASGSPFLLPEPGAGVLPEEGSHACIRALSVHWVRARSVLGPTLGTAPRPCAEHTPAGGPPLPPGRLHAASSGRHRPPHARTHTHTHTHTHARPPHASTTCTAHPQPAQPWQCPCPPRPQAEPRITWRGGRVCSPWPISRC